jgi:hypothetical protein
MMVMQLNQYESFHKNGWNISLCDGLIEFVYDEKFFAITWTINNLSHHMFFRYGEFNYFEIVNDDTNRIEYCSNKDLMKEHNDFKNMVDKINKEL